MTHSSPLQTTEAKILEAAEREFMLKGYDGARTTAIAQAAGVTHAMLHYYFRTKDKLFEQIVSKKILMLRDLIMDTITMPDIPLFEKIERTIAVHLRFVSDNPQLPHFLLGEVFSHPERMELFISKIRLLAPMVVAELQRQIDALAAEGLCRKVDARMLIIDIVSLNVFPFTAARIINPILGGIMEDTEAFLEARTKENIDTIMRKLRP